LGFILLVPAIRQAMIKKVLSSGQFTMYRAGRTTFTQQRDSNVIEGEVVDDDDKTLR
jgi:UPF0716 family protein affecting phage T7 exclusion